MTITHQDKELIAKKAKNQADQYQLSQAKVAIQSGVNKTTITWIFNGQWENYSISDQKWIEVARWCQYDFDSDVWKIDREVKNFKRFYKMCNHAHLNQRMKMISDKQGRCKSTALETYRNDNRANAFYLECDDTMIKSEFLNRLAELLGVKDSLSTSIAGKLNTVCEAILKVKKPIILLDEWNELPSGSKRLIKTLWNKTEGRCAFVICGGMNLKKDMENGVKRAKQSYQEIYSRGGGTILTGVKNETDDASIKRNTTEITRVCQANGLTNPHSIAKIINNFTGDWRVVHEMVIDEKALNRKNASLQVSHKQEVAV
jgi:transcriptional regulator with XRE-family HTH domain